MYDPTQPMTPMTSADLSAAIASGTRTFINQDFSNQQLQLTSTRTTDLVFQNCCFDDASVPGSVSFNTCTWTDCSLRSFSASQAAFFSCTFSSCTFGAHNGDNTNLFEITVGTWTDNAGPVQGWTINNLNALRCDLAGSAMVGVHTCTFEGCQLNDATLSLVTASRFIACGMKTISMSTSSESTLPTILAEDCLLDAGSLTVQTSGAEVVLTRCSLREVTLRGSAGARVNLTQCLLLGATVLGSVYGQMTGCDLRDANLSGVTLCGSSPEAGVAGGFVGCSFAGANLSSAHLSGAFTACSFNSANLQHTVQGTPAPTFDRCGFVFTDLTGSTLPSVTDTTDPVLPSVSISSPATSTGGIITGRVSSAGDNTLLTVSTLSRLAGSSNWQFVSSATPRQDGTFLTRAPAPTGSGTLDEVAVVVMRGTSVFSGSALPPVSTNGQGVVAVASASTVPAGRAALELSGAQAQVSCPALAGDFTLAAWFTFPDPTVQEGRTVALLAIEGGASALLLAAGPDGALTARLGAAGSSAPTLSSGQTNLRDGSWHHVALIRQDGALSLLLDGLPLDATASGGAATSTVGGSGATLRLGWSASETLGGATLSSMSGGLDELSLRGAALRPADVRRTMYLPVAAGESLLGWWSFNAQTGAADAPEGAGTVSATTGALTYLTNTLPFTPANQPYLVVQQQLLRDVGYAPEDPNQTPAEIPAFHLVISVRSAVDLPQWMDLRWRWRTCRRARTRWRCCATRRCSR